MSLHTILVVVVSAVILVSGVAPVHSLSGPYAELERQLESTSDPDTELINRLPSPESAREYQLRSKIQVRPRDALSDLRRAIDRSNSPEESLLLDWLNLALLVEPSTERMSVLESLLTSLPEKRITGRIWLLAGQYAAYSGERELAIKWTNRASRVTLTRPDALLGLAEFQLQEGRTGQARRLMERYLLEFDGASSARLWTLKGRLFEEVGSDSRAYLVFSHVVRQYPASLELTEAERHLEELPLPAVFRPRKDRETNRTGRDLTEGTTVRASTNRGWKLQLGSFLSRKRAVDYKNEMQAKVQQDMIISTANVDGRRFHRVQIIGLDSEFQARELEDSLSARGIDAFILDD